VKGCSTPSSSGGGAKAGEGRRLASGAARGSAASEHLSALTKTLAEGDALSIFAHLAALTA